MRAAVRKLRKRHPMKVVAAVPVAASDAAGQLRSEVDDLVVLEMPVGWFDAIGSYYRNFDQVSDQEVIELMRTL
jgi:predicted phosphoribosyltransferase